METKKEKTSKKQRESKENIPQFKKIIKKNKLAFGALVCFVLLLLFCVIVISALKGRTTTTMVEAPDILLSVQDADAQERNPEKVELITSERDGVREHVYPSPSFVSRTGDTLVYKNGLYIKIEDIVPEEFIPDTIEVDGTQYVKLGGMKDTPVQLTDSISTAVGDTLPSKERKHP